MRSSLLNESYAPSVSETGFQGIVLGPSHLGLPLALARKKKAEAGHVGMYAGKDLPGHRAYSLLGCLLLVQMTF